MARLSRRAAAALILSIGLMTATALARPNFVDLSANQTPIKNQGGQRTCYVFAALAALEAAYNRAGYGQLDLSAGFFNHVGKMMWLHPKWNEVAAKGEDGQESQVGTFGGGTALQNLERLASGLKGPTEAAMPYHSKGFTASDHPDLANAWNSPFWTQRRTHGLKLDGRFLPRSALTQPPAPAVKQISR